MQTLDEAVLPLLLIEEPLFILDSKRPLNEISKSFQQEKFFMIFWLLAILYCHWKVYQYHKKTEESESSR